MCAQFMIKATIPDIQSFFDVNIQTELSGVIDHRTRGFVKTDSSPVLVWENDGLVLKEMKFSLCPSWSKQFPAPFTTYNARMERVKSDKNGRPLFDSNHSPIIEKIYEIPTWKESFLKKRTCLIPMTSAIESSYFGTHAGEVVQFHLPHDEVFLCLGLWNDWVNASTGEIFETFTLITDHPYRFFYETGHDRSVIIIEPSQLKKWLSPKAMAPEELFRFIREQRISLDWRATTERKMSDGWQKRAPSPLEIMELEVFQ